MNTAQLLQHACDNGEIANIVYNGGSHPGKIRPVIPVMMGTDMFLAREPGIAREKSFKLEKVASVTLKDGRTAVNQKAPEIPTPSDVPALSTIREYIVHYCHKFEALGWHVYADEERFGVAALLKSGKPRKHPTITVSFIDRSVHEVFNPDTGEIELIKKPLTGRERPWRVESYNMVQAKSFSELHQAVELFVEEVKKADPMARR